MTKEPRAWHPYLFALYPALALFSNNVLITPLVELLFPSILALLLAGAAILVLMPFVRNSHKRAVIVSILILFFFAFGLVRSLFEGTMIGSLTPGKLTVMTWGLLVLTTLFVVGRIRSDFEKSTRIVNYIAVTLICLPILAALFTSATSQNVEAETIAGKKGGGDTPQHMPDIFYIIPDGYGRQDVLREYYGFDNSDFLAQLRQRGFYIADSSRSNYAQTQLSLPSSMNMRYLDDLPEKLGSGSDNREPLRDLIENSMLRKILESFGYESVSYATGYTITELYDFDHYRKPTVSLSEFQNVLLNYTPLPLVFRRLFGQNDFHRHRVRFILRDIQYQCGKEHPRFVFAHIISPHPPFLFGPDGQEVEPVETFRLFDGDHQRHLLSQEDYIHYYRGQLAYLNKLILQAVDGVLENCKSKPIIIIQSDHGPGSHLYWEDPSKTHLRERLSNLNAYFVPGKVYKHLYPTITPVNTWRLILSEQFGLDLPLLADRSYFSCMSTPYKFIEYHQARDSLSIPRVY